MLNEKLIESALALTGKTIEDMESLLPATWNEKLGEMNDCTVEFSIEKFCYYLLSPEFIEKYADKILGLGKTYNPSYFVSSFLIAIYEYQLGNEESLTNLLSKI